MGLFSAIRNRMVSDAIDRNGLASGTASRCCERCECHVQDDPSSRYLICGLHQIQVGFGQVCGDFASGAPIYTIR